MKQFLVIIKDLWNLYGGIILSTFISWLLNYDKNSMDSFTSYLLLTFTICSLLTIIKSKVFHKKIKPIEKLTLVQPTIKALNNSLDLEGMEHFAFNYC